MTLVVSLVAFLAFGACVVLLIAWLLRRRSVAARVLGGGIALATAVYCFIVSFAILVENIKSWPKVSGVPVLLTFLVIGTAATVSALRGIQARKTL
jgi:hypothetical protein